MFGPDGGNEAARGRRGGPATASSGSIPGWIAEVHTGIVNLDTRLSTQTGELRSSAGWPRRKPASELRATNAGYAPESS